MPSTDATLAARPAPEQTGFRSRFVTTADGARLFVREYGPLASPHPPILCLSGLVRHSRDFHRLALWLASLGRRVVCPDYRGRGRSDRAEDWRAYLPTANLFDMLGVVTALGLGRCVVIGTSMGGILGLGMATFQPGAVAGLVINDIGPDPDPAGLTEILAWVGEDHPQADWPAAIAFLKGRFPWVGAYSEEDWAEQAYGTFVPGEDGQLHADWDTRIARTLNADGSTGDAPPLWQLWAGLGDRPALLLRGEISRVLRPDTYDLMAVGKPALERITLPGVGHTPSLDEPAARAGIERLLGRVAPSEP